MCCLLDDFSTRTKWNHGLQHAIELANQRQKPLVVVEALAIAHQWANDRSHTFVIQGMMDNRKALRRYTCDLCSIR